MYKTKQLYLRDQVIKMIKIKDQEYLNLNDLSQGIATENPIWTWMSERSTLIFLGLWESFSNPDFDLKAYRRLKQQTGLKYYSLSPEKWIEQTAATGMVLRGGRYAGTYAQRDLALEFAAWLSPMLKLLLIRELDQLREQESDAYELEWNIKRMLAKTNNRLLNSAIRAHIVPWATQQGEPAGESYREEADLINQALFGTTAGEWREQHPDFARRGLNVRDFASLNELVVLSNLENINGILIRKKMPREDRFAELKEIAIHQLAALNRKNPEKAEKRFVRNPYVFPAA